MRIDFQSDGGFGAFPGLNLPVHVDTATLPTAEANAVYKMVSDANLFALPANMGSPTPGSADVKQYTLSVEDGALSNTVTFCDLVAHPGLRAIQEYMERKRER